MRKQASERGRGKSLKKRKKKENPPKKFVKKKGELEIHF